MLEFHTTGGARVSFFGLSNIDYITEVKAVKAKRAVDDTYPARCIVTSVTHGNIFLRETYDEVITAIRLYSGIPLPVEDERDWAQADEPEDDDDDDDDAAAHAEGDVP